MTGKRAQLFRRAILVTVLVGAGFWVRSLPSVGMRPVLSAWWPWTGSTIVTLYFSDGQFLFPVSRRIPATDDVPRAALQALLAGPGQTSGLTSPIPPGVEIRSFTLAGGLAQIDLSFPGGHSTGTLNRDTQGGHSNQTVNRDTEFPTLGEIAIVETMTALPGVSSVALSVEGNTLDAPAKRMPLLYYASAKGLAAVRAAATTPRDAIATYMAGPPDETMTGIPRDVRLLKYEHDPVDGLVSLEFAYTDSVRALAIEKPAIMRSVLLGMIASLTEFPGVRAVQIDFGGQSRLGLGQCSDLLRVPQPRPRLLNDERLLGDW